MCFILFYLYNLCFIRKDYSKQEDETNNHENNIVEKNTNNDVIHEINYDSDPPSYASIMKY